MIHKWILEQKSAQVVVMPSVHKILTVQDQRGKICMWADVDKESRLAEFLFYIVGTGQAPNNTSCYVGTVQQDDYVWHIYKGMEVKYD